MPTTAFGARRFHALLLLAAPLLASTAAAYGPPFGMPRVLRVPTNPSLLCAAPGFALHRIEPGEATSEVIVRCERPRGESSTWEVLSSEPVRPGAIHLYEQAGEPLFVMRDAESSQIRRSLPWSVELECTADHPGHLGRLTAALLRREVTLTDQVPLTMVPGSRSSCGAPPENTALAPDSLYVLEAPFGFTLVRVERTLPPPSARPPGILMTPTRSGSVESHVYTFSAHGREGLAWPRWRLLDEDTGRLVIHDQIAPNLVLFRMENPQVGLLAGRRYVVEMTLLHATGAQSGPAHLPFTFEPVDRVRGRDRRGAAILKLALVTFLVVSPLVAVAGVVTSTVLAVKLARRTP